VVLWSTVETRETRGTGEERGGEEAGYGEAQFRKGEGGEPVICDGLHKV
jgi:hypothetical protein